VRRYLGYLLVVLMVLALAAAIGLILFGTLTERVGVPGMIRLVAFDEAAASGDRIRVWAYCEDLDFGRPYQASLLSVRFDDGWHATAYVHSSGMADTEPRSSLTDGRHEFTFAMPETHPRLDVRASGTLWVHPRQVRVLWVDAAALVVGMVTDGRRAPGSAASPATATQGAAPPPASSAEGTATSEALLLQDACAALKSLAVGRQVVYLVTATPGDYARARGRLAAMPVPPGPAVWLKPGDEWNRLVVLKRTWPNVDAAVVCLPVVAQAAERLKLPACLAPAAGDAAGQASGGWREAIERFAPDRGNPLP